VFSSLHIGQKHLWCFDAEAPDLQRREHEGHLSTRKDTNLVGIKGKSGGTMSNETEGGSQFQISAIAFKEGDAWVVQGIEYDIVAHAYDVQSASRAFMRAVVENLIITVHLGRAPFQGIKPAPEHFRSMYEDAGFEMRPLKWFDIALPTAPMPDVAVRLAS
jgi:hypothetical protein